MPRTMERVDTMNVESSEAIRTFDREAQKAAAIHARHTETVNKLAAAKTRAEALTGELARAELAAEGHASSESEKIRRELAKVDDEQADLEHLEIALLKASREQREKVDQARAGVDRLLAEAAAVEWLHDLLPRIQAFAASPGVAALNAAISEVWRTRNRDGAPRVARAWLPLPAEIARFEAVTVEQFELLAKDGYRVPR